MYTASKPLSLEILNKMAAEELIIPQVSNDSQREVIDRFLSITKENLEMLKLENQGIYDSLKVGLRIITEEDDDHTEDYEMCLEFNKDFNIEKDAFLIYPNNTLMLITGKNHIKTTTEIKLENITGIQLLIEKE